LLLSKFGDDEPNEILTPVYLYFNQMYIHNSTNRIHHEVLSASVSEDIIKNKSLKGKLEKLIGVADTKIVGIELSKVGEESSNEKYLWRKNDYNVFGLHRFFEELMEIGTRPLNFKEESVGTQNLYALGAKIIEAIELGSVLVVDELDTSLHPFVTRMIVSMLLNEEINKKNAQIIFTTHDVTLLDKDVIRKDQIWISEKGDDGCSDLYSLQDFDGLREDTPFEKWYLAGKFGGIPQIKSIKNIFEDEIS